MIKRVFLDIDDTLNTFTMFVLNRYFMCCDVGSDFDYQAYRQVLPGERDIIKACPLLGGPDHTEDPKGFWDQLPEWCWSNNPKSPEFDTILHFAQELVPRKNIFLATDVTKSPYCASGKMKWIQDVLPSWLHRNWFITPRKGELAQGREDLLIDDSIGACKRFAAKGGQYVLVPRPWNTNSACLQYLFKTIKEQQ